MKTKIDKYLIEKTENLAFITINDNGELPLENYSIPEGGLKVPIKNEVLVKGIKENKAQETLNLASIADAMLYMMGIDSDFVYNDEYDKFLEVFSKKANFDQKAFMGYMSKKFFEIGELQEALIYIKSFIRKYPEDEMGLYHYAIICQEISKREIDKSDEKAVNAYLLEALWALEKLVEINPNNSLVHYHLGYHYFNQKQFIKTKLTWEKAMDLGLDEQMVAEIQENLIKMDFKIRYEEGYNLVLQGKPEEGVELLLPILDDHPDWWNLLFMIGIAYKGMGDIEKAKEYFNRVLIIEPQQVDSIVELSLCEAAQLNLDRTIELLEQAAKLRKDNPEILCNLGMAYLNNQNVDDAKYYIERAYSIDPKDEITIVCLKEVQKYL